METHTPELLLEAQTILEANLDTYKTAVGATAADITANSQDRANLAQAIANGVLIETDKQVSTGIKNAVYNGDPNAKVAGYPAFEIQPLPFPDVPSGAESRYRDLKRRFKSAKGYTKTIGIALGFESAETGKPSLDSLVGTATLKDLGGYEFQADFKKSGASGMMFQFRLKGTEKWANEKIALTSPVVIKVDTPTVEGAAVQIEVRCRPLKGNELVGQWSPLYVLTVNP